MTTIEKLQKVIDERNEIIELGPFKINAIEYRARAIVSDETGYGPSLEAALVDLLANMGAL